MEGQNIQSQTRRISPARSDSTPKVDAAVAIMKGLNPVEQDQVFRDLGIVVLHTNYQRDGKPHVRFVQYSPLASWFCRQIASTLNIVSDYREFIASGRIAPETEDFTILQQISVSNFTDTGLPVTPDIFKAAETELTVAGQKIRGRMLALREKIPVRSNRKRPQNEQKSVVEGTTDAQATAEAQPDSMPESPHSGRKRPPKGVLPDPGELPEESAELPQAAPAE